MPNAQSLEDHVRGHDFPAHVRTCGPCRFWKHRWKWSQELTFQNTVSGKREPWLGYQNGAAVCIVCAAYTGPGKRDSFASGSGSFLRVSNLKRHGNGTRKQKILLEEAGDGPRAGINWTHELAIRDWNGHKRVDVSSGMAVSAANSLAISKTEAATEGDYSTFLFARTLLETRGSFRDFESWTAAASSGNSGIQVGSRRIASEHTATLAKYEQLATQRFLREGAIFRLQADGLKRVYQVEIGTLLWKIPTSLRVYKENVSSFRWIEELGPQGPWLVDRVIGARDFPTNMGTADKVEMLEDCARRAAVSAVGEVDTKLFAHMKKQTRVWTSDGADRDVFFAAKAVFPGLLFEAWDESHSGVKLLQKALQDDPEIKRVDELLVTGKKPASLAKFLSTSDVFRKKFGDAQAAVDAAWVKNFGWAPQRFQSRARPYARECRRWKAIWSAVASEAASASPDRRALATMYLMELGGEFSSRLLLAGLLADLSVEHYNWVAGGDKSNPDGSSVMIRFESFIHRLRVLFMEGMILKIPDSYTGVSLIFLKENSFYHFGSRVQTFGLGDMAETSVQNVVGAILRRIQKVVANVVTLGGVYRPESSWFKVFEAFALPSPMSDNVAGSAATYGAPQKTCVSSLERICRAAQIPLEDAFREWRALLPRAEVFSKAGANMRQAWGRASAEFPEYPRGRALVECALIWKTSTGNLERRYRDYKEFATPERAQLFDVTVESCLVALQGPPSRLMATWADASQGAQYLKELAQLHRQVHGQSRNWSAGQPKQRRDAGIARPAASLGPETEASFARKRAAATAAVLDMSPSKRARLIGDLPVSASSEDLAPTAAWAERARKRAADEKNRQLGGEARAAKAREKLENRVIRSSVQPSAARDLEDLPSLRAGFALLRAKDQKANHIARFRQFRCTSDPVEFVKRVVADSATSQRGHLVLAPVSEISDFAVCARIAAVLLGTYFADSEDFVNKGRDSGCQYNEQWKNSRATFRIAISDGLAAEFPSLPSVFRAIAAAPASCFELFSVRHLTKRHKQEVRKKRPRIGQHMGIFATEAERDAAPEKVRPIYMLRVGFWRRFCSARDKAVCPGFPK